MSFHSIPPAFRRGQISVLPLAALLVVVLIAPALSALAEGPAAAALGFTPTPTSPPPPATPSAPGPGVTPTPGSQPDGSDPVITKRGDPALALPGEEVIFTIEVTNPGQEAAVDVVVVDTLSEHLELLEVNATQGTILVEGQTVTVQVGVVGSGFVVEIVIRTRVRADAPAPLDLENVVRFHSPNGGDFDSPPATVVVPGVSLPRTGGSQQGVGPALVGLCVGATLVVALWGAWLNSRPHDTL